MKRFLAIVLSTLVMSSQSIGAEGSRTVRSGEPTRIRKYFSWNPDCTYKVFNIRITAKPQHGVVEPRFGDHILSTTDVVSGALPTACVGKLIRDVELYYSSEAGFTGSDRFSVEAWAAGVGKLTDTYTLEVK